MVLQEALLTVPGFAIAGSSWLAPGIVPIASAAAAMLVWRVGLDWSGSRLLVLQLRSSGSGRRSRSSTRRSSLASTQATSSTARFSLSRFASSNGPTWRIGTFGLRLRARFLETSQIVPVAAGLIAWTIWNQLSVCRLWAAIPLGRPRCAALDHLERDAQLGVTAPKPNGDGLTYERRLRLSSHRSCR